MKGGARKVGECVSDWEFGWVWCERGRTEPEQWKGFDSVKLRRDFEGGQSVSNDQ